MFCYKSYNNFSHGSPIFAYPRGAGYSFYFHTKHGDKFYKWFKGSKIEVIAKMNKFEDNNT